MTKNQHSGINSPIPYYQAPYSLDTSSKKFNCPSCGQRRFVRFMNQEGIYLEEIYGRCDRESSCGYFHKPTSHTKLFKINSFEKNPEIKQPRYVPIETVLQTMKSYNNNFFVQWLINLIGFTSAMDLVTKFNIGTAKGGATIFWQIDKTGNVRTAQKILYGPDGKRSRQIPPSRIFTVTSGYESCLFGEHQIITIPPTAIIGIVESEKTAILASYFYPIFDDIPIVWMACSGSNGMTFTKINTLSNRKVILIPDFSLSARSLWGAIPMRMKNEKIDQDGEIENNYRSIYIKLKSIGCHVRVIDLFPNINDGSDLGDYIIGMIQKRMQSYTT